jgi:hypothetical protein
MVRVAACCPLTPRCHVCPHRTDCRAGQAPP